MCLEYASLALSTCVYHLRVAGEMEYTNEARHRISEPKHTGVRVVVNVSPFVCVEGFAGLFIRRVNSEKNRIPLWLGPNPQRIFDLKDRDFLEVFAGRAAVTTALRDVACCHQCL